MELYHIHRNNDCDEYFKEGMILDPGNGFNVMHKNLLTDSASIIVNQKKYNDITYNYRLFFSDYIDKKIKRDNITKEELENILIFARNYIHNSALGIREMILEEIRRESFSDRPSRYNCIWLADEVSLEFWLDRLSLKKGGYQVFRVDAIGNIFVSTNTLLPSYQLSHKDMYDKAKNYWNPTKEDLKDAKDKEYLFEGKLKILERIK